MSKQTKVNISVADAFKIDVPKGVVVPGYATPSVFTPKIDEHYEFVKETLSDILAWMHLSQSMPDGLYLTGPTGCGKSSVICQVMARLNLPLQRVNAHSQMEIPELLGHHTVIDGDLVWQDGPLTTAYRFGHAFLLDEIDLLEPAVAAGLNSILEGAPLTLAQNGGEVIHPHPDFRFIATGNTNGGGDANGLWSGTTKQNTAFMDRMWVIEVGYPAADLEERVLKAKVGLPDDTASKMISFANHIRELFMGTNESAGAIEITMSTRTLVRWGMMSLFMTSKKLEGTYPIKYALERALANRGTPTTKFALLEACDRFFDVSSV